METVNLLFPDKGDMSGFLAHPVFRQAQCWRLGRVVAGWWRAGARLQSAGAVLFVIYLFSAVALARRFTCDCE